MAGIAAIALFFVSLLFQLWDVTHGHVNWQTFALAGLLFLAIHVTSPWYPWRHA
jgi:hypothetical protein